MCSEGNNPGSTPPPPPERDLIEAAFEQASPRGSSVSFEGDLPAADTFPGYELVREVHRGGQGAVYLAIQKATKQRVAIKVMHGGPFQGSSGKARFEREVQVLGQLNHPNIVRIHDSGTTADGSCFYVMDYISGRSLDTVISESKKQPVDETLRLFGKICEAVNAAHLRGVIHRDLKPANIRINSAGEPIVVDFGLAKTAVPDVTEESRPQLMTMTGQFIGSLPWASPEQAEGVPDKIDVRTDVYSLGVILYQMLTGRFPYEVIGNLRDVLDNILRAEPARPSTVRRQINDEVETIVLKCLSKERDRRYQSAGELGRDIRHYLMGEPIEAKRDSGWYFISKTMRRHRIPVAFAATLLLLLIGFAIAMWVAWAAEARQRKRADANADATTLALEAERREHLRADANFELVRDQARMFMFDFNQAIADLRGGTRARELLFTKAKESLDRLKSQAGNDGSDLGLQREIADASDLLGDIRGGLYLPRLGETSTARASYAEARTIRERIAAARSGDFRSHADLGESFKRSAQIMMTDLNYREAAAEAAQGVASYDQAIALASREPATAVTKLTDGRAQVVYTQADAWGALLDTPRAGVSPDDAVKKSRALLNEAEAYWLKRVTTAPEDARAARSFGVCRDNQAVLTSRLGTLLVRQAKPLLTTDPKQAAELTGQAAQRFTEARGLAQTALADFQKLSREHPENAEWRRDCYLALHTIGLTHMLAGDAFKALADTDPAAAGRATEEWTKAASAFGQAMRVTEDLANSDPSNLQARRDQVVVQNKAGNILRNLGRLDEAEAVFKKSLEVRTDLNQTDQTPQSRRDLAVGLYKVGQVYELEAGKEAGPRKRELLILAEQHYTLASAQFGSLKDAGGTPSDQSSVKEVQAAAARCSEGLRALEP